MNGNDQKKRLRKRFTGFLVCSALLFAGLFVAGANFDVFAKMVTGLYMLYLGGQTATDWQKAKNGNQGH